MEGLQELTNALLNGTIPIPYGLPFPKIGGSQPQPKIAIAIISGTGKATDFKFGRYIHKVHLNKSSSKVLEKRDHVRICKCPKFSEYPLLSQEWVKLRASNLAGTFTGSIRTKAFKKFGKKDA